MSKNLQMALLGRPAITCLDLVTRLDSINIATLKKTYPKLCSGLGVIKQLYAIKLQPNAVPFLLKTPRRIPLPLRCKVKEELQCMENISVINRVEEPTDWCSGFGGGTKKRWDCSALCGFNKVE